MDFVGNFEILKQIWIEDTFDDALNLSPLRRPRDLCLYEFDDGDGDVVDVVVVVFDVVDVVVVENGLGYGWIEHVDQPTIVRG